MTRLLAALAPSSPGRRTRRRVLIARLLALLVASGGVAFAVQAGVRSEPRTVTLLARDMAFYLPGDPTPNPRLAVARGERVRFVLRNEEAGIPHDLAIESDEERARTAVIRGAGETVNLTFRAPEAAGEYTYLCTMHSRMMRGVLEVR